MTLAFSGKDKIQTQKGSNKRLSILPRTHSVPIFGEIPFVKPQDDKRLKTMENKREKTKKQVFFWLTFCPDWTSDKNSPKTRYVFTLIFLSFFLFFIYIYFLTVYLLFKRHFVASQRGFPRKFAYSVFKINKRSPFEPHFCVLIGFRYTSVESNFNASERRIRSSMIGGKTENKLGYLSFPLNLGIFRFIFNGR